jgi:hypothetical protein
VIEPDFSLRSGHTRKPREGTPANRASRDASGGVGTELSNLIPDWAVRDLSGCQCKSWAAKMDRYGVQWCELNRKAIVNHLVSSREYLVPALRLLPEAVIRAGADALLTKAIANFLKRQQQR